MPIHDLNDDNDGLPFTRTADVCVVGAGMAGLLLARRLAGRGLHIVVVESGGLAFDEAVHELNAVELPAGSYSRALTNHYRGLGGTSSRWGGRTIPISAFEIGPRPHVSLPGWPIDPADLVSYEAEIQQLFGLTPGSFEEDVLEEIDDGRLFPRNDPDFTCRWAKWPHFRQCNLATVFSADLRQLDGPEIWLNATVTGFRLDREAGRLRSVETTNFSGRRLSITAPQFVFAAGTIETTRLLLWLRASSDDQALARSAVLGRYFQDHLNLDAGNISRANPVLSNRRFGYHFTGATRRSMQLELSPSAQIDDQIAGAFAYVAMDLGNSALAKVKAVARGLQQRRVEIAMAAELSSNLGLLARSVYWRYRRQQLYVPPDIAFRINICVEQMPDSANHIALDIARDRLGLPKAAINWRPTKADEHTFRAAISRLKAYWRRAGFDVDCPIEWDIDEATPVIDRCEDYAHPSGTTRMGVSITDSVVDPQLRCHELPNLSIASASTFPSAGSANPSLTIMALALRLADRLAGEFYAGQVASASPPGNLARAAG